MRWLENLRSLGQALVELARSEVAALRADLGYSARRLRGVLVLLGVTAGFVFWALGAATAAAVMLLALRLQPWLAALAVAAALLLAAAVTLLIVRRRWRALETPITTVRRRLAEHADWWESSVLARDEEHRPPERDADAR